MATLNILGATYGLNDVTSIVRTRIQNDTLTVIADAPTLGDAMPATAKSLVIVYQYDNRAPRVAITQTGQTLTLTDDHAVTPWSPAPAGQLTVLGAAYGLGDVTAQVRGFIQNNQLNFLAANGIFNNDPWPMVLKTLVVVYSYNGVPVVKTVQENTQLEIAALANKPLFILGAAYGPSNITAIIAAQVNTFEELHVAVNAATLGDPWPGNSKSLSLVYQYEGERPQLAIAPTAVSWILSTSRNRPINPRLTPANFRFWEPAMVWSMSPAPSPAKYKTANCKCWRQMASSIEMAGQWY